MTTETCYPPIDAVITWVDGGDPAHKERLGSYLETLNGVRPADASSTRFHDAGEIDYCVASLFRFAPWLRRIHIVTDRQTPSLIKALENTPYRDRIRVVDHSEIFRGFEENLPTFNSSTILSVLWRIDDLAENFLFLNDDFALLQPVKPTDFFIDDKVVLRGKWRPFSDTRWSKKIGRFLKKLFSSVDKKGAPRAGYLAAQELSARLVGFTDKYFQIPHNPHAWKKSTQAAYFAAHPEVLAENVSYKLRSPKQFIGEALAAHLEWDRNAVVVDEQLKTLQLKPGDQSVARLTRKIASADQNPDIAFVCVQSLDRGCEESQQLITRWLDRRIGRLSDLGKPLSD